ncbi:DUF2089 domain-containing protein [Clostridium formicaceticum]|uniref:DUF2089 domain-containing protein n=1 Tax=Clostridium formicaceticum TaxID=1497 RepID=A0AAC9RNV2_9CLOT|nr:DUF2089 domain-containing protein [Clostridium formicaceticum]AOY77963.1 hypothetical protein BJL90_20100 [Clostridium formicaceticum]ARE88585.1 hypothetical protein CLFO_29910 [Clostridium formicaceticum]
MKYKAPSQCPICRDELSITKMSCSTCKTSLEGDFTGCKFCKLPGEQLEFIEVFIKCRGNIKDVEKELGISYPTVRNRLETVIQALGYSVEKIEDRTDDRLSQNMAEKRQLILTALENGELTSEEAVQQLRKLGK